MMIPLKGFLFALLLVIPTANAARFLSEPPVASIDVTSIAKSLWANSPIAPPVASIDVESIAKSLSANSPTAGDLSYSLAGTPLPANLPDLPANVNISSISDSLQNAAQNNSVQSATQSDPVQSATQNDPVQSAIQNLPELSSVEAQLPKDLPDIPKMPNMNIPDFAMPPASSPKLSMFGHEINLPSFLNIWGKHS